MAPSRTASFPWTSRLVISESCRSGRVVAVDVRSPLRIRHAAMWIGAGNGRSSGNVRDVRSRLLAGGRSFLGDLRLGQLAVLVSLRQDLDGEVRAVAHAQTAPDAVRGLDDRVVSQDEAVLRADLDADVAALAPLIDPPNVDEVDNRGGAMCAFSGGVHGSYGRISIVSTAAR